MDFIIICHVSLLVCGVKIILWGKDWGKKWGTESNKITKALNALIGIGCFFFMFLDPAFL